MDSIEKAERYAGEKTHLERYRQIGEYIKSEQVGVGKDLKVLWLMLVFSVLLKKPVLILLGLPIIIFRRFSVGVRKFIAENFPLN